MKRPDLDTTAPYHKKSGAKTITGTTASNTWWVPTSERNAGVDADPVCSAEPLPPALVVAACGF